MDLIVFAQLVDYERPLSIPKVVRERSESDFFATYFRKGLQFQSFLFVIFATARKSIRKLTLLFVQMKTEKSLATESCVYIMQKSRKSNK